MTENVLDFSKFKERAEQARFDAIVEEQQHDEEFIEGFTEFVLFQIVEAAWEGGFDASNNPTSIRDIMLIGEALKGFLLRTKGSYHRTHDISEPLFVFPSDTEELEKFLRAMQLQEVDDDEYD